MTKSRKRNGKRGITAIEKDLEDARLRYAEHRKSTCHLLLLGDTSIQRTLVDRVYDNLRGDEYIGDHLEVIVESAGGDIDAAYNLAQLFRSHAPENLVFVIPRWAKSAATLLVCGGDTVCMTPIAELGPLDPQITATNPFEQRIERFSPLHIESTLQLIRDEFESGNSKLADGLMQRLQFPLTLGRFKKSLEVGRDYVEKLLTTRMLKDEAETAQKIAERLTSGYADHSWCITIGEAKELGLKVEELDDAALDIVWHIHKLSQEKAAKLKEIKKAKMKKELKDIPPELLDRLNVDSVQASELELTNPQD